MGERGWGERKDPAPGAAYHENIMSRHSISAADLCRRCLMVIALAAIGPLHAADLVVSAGFPVNSTAEATVRGAVAAANSRFPVLVNAGGNIFRFGPVGLGFELPVLIGGPSRAETGASGTQALAYAESMKWGFTPGVRLRLAPPLVPFTPWVSLGAGVAGLDRAGVAVAAAPTVASGSSTVFARSVAGGVDVKPFPFLLFRAELRNLTYKTPDGAFTGIVSFRGDSRNALMFLVGVGLRF